MMYLNIPCQVTKRTLQGKEIIEGTLVGLFQYSEVLAPSGLVGGHPGGVVAYPIAIVRHKGGLMETRLSKVVLVTNDTPKMSENYETMMRNTQEELFARQLFQNHNNLLTEQNKKHDGGYL